MPKKVFWPVTLIIMGLIFMASDMGYLPARFWNLWPVILIVVGLGGLLTSDRNEWIVDTKAPAKRKAKRKSTKKKTAAKRKTTRKRK